MTKYPFQRETSFLLLKIEKAELEIDQENEFSSSTSSYVIEQKF